MAKKNKYREYFDIDEDYFPCIDDAAINAGAPWENTYPHNTFINMLTEMERALARQNNGKTLWIEGAYGTGKSQCAYALQKILEVSETELCSYWNNFEPLKKKTDLLEKLIGHKKQKIVIVYRYASGGIKSARDFFFAIQESVKSALVKQNMPYLGENTIKESIIVWLEDDDHKLMFNSMLQNPSKEWKALFSQSTADEILSSLRKGGDIKTLITNIFRLADKEGITALNIDADRLIAWLSDIIDKNNIKVVFIWDEFSDYLKSNRESLSEFQRIVALVQNKPFYLIVITHEPQQIYIGENDRGNQAKVSDRFVSIPITLPDNIAFDLIGHAFNIKLAAKQDWANLANDLNNRVNDSRTKVMEAAKIDNPQVMKNIMPLHPMAAFLLKNIASAFKSNQRSMFDFIKTKKTDDIKAFQWFIENTGPFDDHPLLTVDMLWDFFYEKGRDNLTSDIRLILDTYPQQQNLRDDEKSVLKAILIMQAIDQRLGGTIDLFKTTEQHLSYVFEGISDLEGSRPGNIAKSLKEKGILVTSPISGGRFIYNAAVLAVDQAKIDKFKNDLRKECTTSKLVTEGGLSTVLSLSSALRLRFESEPATGKITPVTTQDFARTINTLREKSVVWNFLAVIAFAKDETEATTLRKIIKTTVADKQYEHIIFIDALSTPLGLEAFDQWIDFSAMAMYYQGNNNASSRENAEKAKRELDQNWRNRIYNGQFIVYTYKNQVGEKFSNAQSVLSILQTIVTNRFQYVFDFKNLSESQLKATALKQSAKSGIIETTSGIVVGIEKNVLPNVWKVEKYWESPSTASLPISKIKIEIEKLIEASFSQNGQISIDEIYNYLERAYGFAPCNLSAFLAGFLLKEYSSEPFRYSDSNGGHEPMTQDKLAEMIGNYIGKNPKPTYLVKMTPDEKAFYELTEKTWKIQKNSCSSASQAAILVAAKIRELGLPVWCLKEVDSNGIFEIVKKYIDLVQLEGKEAHEKAIEIGRIAMVKPSLWDNLSALLTSKNCQIGMQQYLQSFENGKILELANDIGVGISIIITDISNLFKVKHSSLWEKETGEDEIRKLITDYGITKETNAILNVSAHSLEEAFKEWNERIKFLHISYESLRAKFPKLAKIFDTLIKVFQQTDILPDQLKAFHSELSIHSTKMMDLFTNDKKVFSEIYEPYLENLTDDDIASVKSILPTIMFELSKNDCNAKVKDGAEEFRKNQLKTQLFRLWKENTGSKNPIEWSNRFRTPILCCVPETEFEIAKKSFDTLNRNWGTDNEIKAALQYLKKTKLFDVLHDEKLRNEAFISGVIGEYRILLSDINKVRDTLENLLIDTYDWRDNPNVKEKVKKLAEAEYNSGGSDKILKKIDEMDGVQLKLYLKRLVKNSITVGIEILTDEGK